MNERGGRTERFTGASSGLGIARPLIAERVRLVLSGRNDGALTRLRDEFVGHGANAEVVDPDVADPTTVDGLIERPDAQVGP